jgi:hypothetical protein
MIEETAVAAGFIGLAVAAFALAVRVGMLVGLRLDRALDARTSEGGGDKSVIDDMSGREEYRGE